MARELRPGCQAAGNRRDSMRQFCRVARDGCGPVSDSSPTRPPPFGPRFASLPSRATSHASISSRALLPSQTCASKYPPRPKIPSHACKAFCPEPGLRRIRMQPFGPKTICWRHRWPGPVRCAQSSAKLSPPTTARVAASSASANLWQVREWRPQQAKNLSCQAAFSSVPNRP